MKKIITVLVCVLLCSALVFTGCGTKDEYKTKYDKEVTGVVATIEGEEITQADFNIYYKLTYDQMSQYAMYYGEDWLNMEIDEEGTTLKDSFKKDSLDQLKQMVALCQYAEKEYKISVDDKEIKNNAKKERDSLIESLGGKDAYIAFLEEYRTTDAAILRYFARFGVYDAVNEKMTSVGGVAYIEDEELIAEFSQDYMRVQHILISTSEQTDENGETIPARSDAEAQAIVKEVIAKIEAGEDFDSLIEEYDEDPGMEPGGFYTFTYGEMVPEFEEASLNLAVGEYTKEGVKTDYGYHIIKKYDIDTQDQKFVQFRDSKQGEIVMGILQEKTDAVTVESKDDVIDAFVEPWLVEMEEAAAQAQAEAEAQTEAEGVIVEEESAE